MQLYIWLITLVKVYCYTHLIKSSEKTIWSSALLEPIYMSIRRHYSLELRYHYWRHSFVLPVLIHRVFHIHAHNRTESLEFNAIIWLITHGKSPAFQGRLDTYFYHHVVKRFYDKVSSALESQFKSFVSEKLNVISIKIFEDFPQIIFRKKISV